MACVDPKKIKIVLIDLDGTLVDSLPLLFKVYNGFLEQHGIKGNRDEFDQLSGPSIIEVIEKLKSKYNLPDSVESYVNSYQKLLYYYYTQNLSLFAGARQCLRLIREMGLRLLLVTSATRLLADGFLESQGLEEAFEKVISSDGLKKAKPDPAIYQKALFAAGVSADEAIAVEDSKKGVQAALSAHIYTIQMIHESTRIEGIGQSKMTQVNDWFDLMDLFKVWYG